MTYSSTVVLDQRERDTGVDFRGNFWDQLFSVNFMVLITNMAGDQAGEDAFFVKTPKTAQKTHFPYLKNDCSHELLSPLILSRMGTFYSDFSFS